LKADEILAQRSAVPALNGRKRVLDTQLGDGIIPPKRLRKNGVSAKEYERLKKIAHGGDARHKDVVTGNGEASYDPWEVQSLDAKENRDFLDEKKPIKEPETLKHQPVSLVVDRRQLKAVRTPAAEKSYNPTFEAWSGRIEREGNKEVEAEKQRLEEAAREEERQRLIEEAQKQEDLLPEYDESDWETEWEGIASESEQTAEWLQKKKPQRKTQAERNKIKRRKEEESRRKWDQNQKQAEEQAYRIKALAKQVKENEKLQNEKLAAKAAPPPEDNSDDGDDLVLRKKAIGKNP
jgi:nucleolar protein 53